MNVQNPHGSTGNPSSVRKRIRKKKLPGTSKSARALRRKIRIQKARREAFLKKIFHIIRKSVKITPPCIQKVAKKRANWEKEIAERRRKRIREKYPDYTSDDELPEQSSRSDLQILPGGSRRNVQNPLFTDSEILPNVSGHRRQDNEEILLSYPQSITIITDASASSWDLLSFKNLQQCLEDHYRTDQLPQNQPHSENNSDESSIKSSDSKHSYVFRNLLYNTNEAEEILFEQRIFRPNFPMDVLSEDQHILGDIRNVFGSEGKFKDSTSQTETLNMQQIGDDIEFRTRCYSDDRYRYDWDKFLERWEGMHIVPESTSKAQQLEQAKRSLKRKKIPGNPFNGQAKKRGAIPSSMSTSSGKEHSSNLKSVLPSFEREMDIIVHKVSSKAPETGTTSKLEKFIKNTKIKLFESRELPPFTKKYISFDHASLPTRMNGSFIFWNKNRVEEKAGGTNNSTDKIEELNVVEGDDAGGDIEMVS